MSAKVNKIAEHLTRKALEVDELFQGCEKRAFRFRENNVGKTDYLTTRKYEELVGDMRVLKGIRNDLKKILVKFDEGKYLKRPKKEKTLQ